MEEIPGSGVWRAQRSWLLPPGLVTTAARGEATLAPGARWDDVLLRTTATSPPGWALLPASFAPGAACGGRRVRVRSCSAARSSLPTRHPAENKQQGRVDPVSVLFLLKKLLPRLLSLSFWLLCWMQLAKWFLNRGDSDYI